MSTTPTSRYLLLDHFRGLAALAVVLFHSYGGWISGGSLVLPEPFAYVLLNGWRGVQVFFVVSGYCITERVATEYRHGGSAQRFLLDRLLRIFPTYWTALLFLAVLNLAALPFNHGSLQANAMGWSAVPTNLSDFAATLVLFEVWLGRSPYLLVSWTLSFEILFYLIAAGALALALRTRRPAVSLALGVLLALLGVIPATRLWVPVIAAWPQFFAGALAWLLIRRISRLAARAAIATLLFLGLATAALLLQHNSDTLVAAGTAWILVLLQPVDRALAQWSGLRWLATLGLWSYSIYLVHLPLISKSRNLLGRWFEHSPIAVLVPAACALFSISLAAVFFHCVELRFERRRKTLLPRLWPFRRPEPRLATAVP